MSTSDAFEVGLDLLSRREHSRRELALKLRRRGFETALIEAALARLEERAYLNENRFAESRARVLFRKGYGEGYVRADLQNKGVRVEIPQLRAWRKEMSAGDDPMAAARALLAKKLRSEDPPSLDRAGRRKLEQRLLSLLLRKGFDLDQARRVLREELPA